MTKNNKINYIEIPAQNIIATKAFLGEVFGWTFIDYGPDYCSFTAQGVDGGFFKSDLVMSTEKGSSLIVLYNNELEMVQDKINKAGGKIIKATFSFPGEECFILAIPMEMNMRYGQSDSVKSFPSFLSVRHVCTKSNNLSELYPMDLVE